jgi:rhodanese-related sulfurtransferase
MQIVDVRERDEFSGGHIAQARWIPMPRLLGPHPPLVPDREIVLVCRTGRRTTRVIYTLQQQGYDNLVHLVGGMMAWEQAGLPVIIE